jgi:Fusaric acid resistance protein family
VSQIKFWTLDPPRRPMIEMGRMVDALKRFAPALLHGVRLWVAVCLALYVAFWLQLDNEYWAGVTVAITFESSLGASLRKVWFYVIGTVIGAVAIVALTACFPQDRFGFLIGLALWAAACVFVSTMLRNFAAFAAALAGFTAAIIASGELGATGGASDGVFLLALTRATDICIGIASTAIVLSWTDFGAANRWLSAQLAAILSSIAGGLSGAFSPSASGSPPLGSVQRDIAGRVAGLDKAIDEAIGESSNLRLRSSVLQGAVGGLVAALSGWQMAAYRLAQLPLDDRRREAEAIQHLIPQELRSGGATSWAANPSRISQACIATVRALIALPRRTPSVRLLADETAEALMGVRRALDGVLLLADPAHAVRRRRRARFHVPDWLPCLVNSVRVFITIGAVELVWVATAWPTGALATAFATIYVLLLTLRGDQVHSTAADFLIGVCLTSAAAAVVKFAVLPHLETFAGLCLAIGLVLVPAGAAIALRWRPAIFTFTSIFFGLLLEAQNQMVYDTQQFYNLALAMAIGLGSAALSFRLLPPLSPALRARRLLALASRDVRRLTKRPAAWTLDDWRGRIYSRLGALPAQAETSERAQILAVLSIGEKIIRLRRIARRFRLQGAVDAAFHAVARGDGPGAMERLDQLDTLLASAPFDMPGAWARIRARGCILAISEALAQQTIGGVTEMAR